MMIGLLILASAVALGPPASKRGKRMHIDGVDVAAASPDGALVATGSSGGEVIVWQRAPFRPLGELVGSGRDRITSLAFDGAGKQLAVGHHGSGTVEVWDAATLTRTRTIDAFSGRVAAVAYHPGKDVVAVLGADRGAPADGSGADDLPPPLTTYRVRLFQGARRTADVDTGSKKAWSLAFDNGGRRVLAGLQDAVVAYSDALVEHQRTAHAGECVAASVAAGVLCIVSSSSAACYDGAKAVPIEGASAPARGALIVDGHLYTGTYDAVECRKLGSSGVVSRLDGRSSAIVAVGSQVWVFLESRAVVYEGGKPTGTTHSLAAQHQ